MLTLHQCVSRDHFLMGMFYGKEPKCNLLSVLSRQLVNLYIIYRFQYASSLASSVTDGLPMVVTWSEGLIFHTCLLFVWSPVFKWMCLTSSLDRSRFIIILYLSECESFSLVAPPNHQRKKRKSKSQRNYCFLTTVKSRSIPPCGSHSFTPPKMSQLERDSHSAHDNSSLLR